MTELTPEQLAYAIRDIQENSHIRKRYKCLYQGKPLSYWAKQLGVTSTCVYQRVKRYGTPTPVAKSKSKLFYKGKSLMQWAKEMGKGNKYGNLRLNLLAYGSIFRPKNKLHDLIDQPLPLPLPKLFQGHSRIYWANKLGVSENRVYQHLRKYGNLNHMAPSRSKKRSESTMANKKYLDKTMTQWAYELNCSTEHIMNWFKTHGNLDYLIANPKRNKHAAK